MHYPPFGIDTDRALVDSETMKDFYYFTFVPLYGFTIFTASMTHIQ